MTSPKPTPIKDRIAQHFKPGMSYCVLERLVFPWDKFPRAWKYGSHGGPPACRRVLKVALRRHGYSVTVGYLSEQRVHLMLKQAT